MTSFVPKRRVPAGTRRFTSSLYWSMEPLNMPVLTPVV
jgi:hypothetical protein